MGKSKALLAHSKDQRNTFSSSHLDGCFFVLVFRVFWFFVYVRLCSLVILCHFLLMEKAADTLKITMNLYI